MVRIGKNIESTEQLTLIDGVYNELANLGTSRDQRLNTSFSALRSLNEASLFTQWDTDWLSGKIVDIPVDEMTREWRVFENLDAEKQEALKAIENRLKIREKLNKAMKFGRLYGTAYLYLVTSKNPTGPLDFDKPTGDLVNLIVYDSTELQPSQNLIDDITDPNYRLPESYTVRETNVTIHTSRLLKFHGVELPYKELKNNNWTHRSVLYRVYEAVLNSGILTEGVASMIFNTNVDVIKVPNLMSHIRSAAKLAQLKERFQAAANLKSFNNMLLIDEKEDYTKKNNTFSGLHDLIDTYLGIVAGSADIPKTRLLGSSPGGMNATGESDLKNYYDSVSSKQKTIMTPAFYLIDKLLQGLIGLSSEEAIQYSFPPLFQLDDAQKATAKRTNAQADQLYLQMGVITFEDIQNTLAKNKAYVTITGTGENTEDNESEEETEEDNDNNDKGNEDETGLKKGGKDV